MTNNTCTFSLSASIVDLFRSAKPRSKLFIQQIPPGFTEEEFKELISSYLDKIDYFVFRPGKIIRDSYGHLIGLDHPNYGFATINFKNPKTCPKFFREFNQFPLSDSYSNKIVNISKSFYILLDVKSKLLVEFALMQNIPDFSVPLPASFSFKDLPIYKEFLKTFPFAAKAEEELKSSLGPIEIDLEEDGSGVASTDISGEIVKNTSELDTKLLISTSPSLELPPVTFSKLISTRNDSSEVVTPLTEFAKSIGLNRRLPPAKNIEKRRVETKEEKKQRRKEKKSEEKRKKKENKKSRENSEPAETTEKKSFKTSDPKDERVKKNGSLVQNAPQAAQIKGVPKILARKPVESKEQVVTPQTVKQPEFIKSSDLKKEESKQQFKNRKQKSSHENEKVVKPARETYIRPENCIKESQTNAISNINNNVKCEPEVPPKMGKIVFKTKTNEQNSEEKIEPKPVVKSAAKPEAKAKKNLIPEPSKLKQIQSNPLQLNMAPANVPVKKVFTSSSKKREIEMQQNANGTGNGNGN